MFRQQQELEPKNEQSPVELNITLNSSSSADINIDTDRSEANFFRTLTTMRDLTNSQGIYEHAYELFKNEKLTLMELIARCDKYAFGVQMYKNLLETLTQTAIENSHNFVKKNERIFFYNQLRHAKSYLDLVIALFSALQNSKIPTASFFNYGLTEKSILNLLNNLSNDMLAEKNVSVYSEGPYIPGGHNDSNPSYKFNYSYLYSFSDQTELKAVLDLYLNYYEQQSGGTVRKFGQQTLAFTKDKQAMVLFDFNVVTDYFIQESKHALSERTTTNIINCMALLLSLDISPQELPSTLRLCSSINYKNTHWTGLKIEIEGLLPLYKEVYAFHKNDPLSDPFEIDEQKVFRNKVVGIRRALLAMTPESFWQQYPKLPKIKDTQEPESETLMAIFKEYQIKMSAKHYDSMNTGSSFKEVERSMQPLKKAFQFKCEECNCSRQVGLTCGDHTVCNLVGVGLYNTVPTLNSPNMPSSDLLRDLLESAKRHEADLNLVDEIVKPAILGIPGTIAEDKSEKEFESDDDASFHFDEGKIKELINALAERIYHLIDGDPSDIFRAIYRYRDSIFLEQALLGNKPISDIFTLSKTKENYAELRNRAYFLKSLVTPGKYNKVRDVLLRDLKVQPDELNAFYATTQKFLREKEMELELRYEKDHPQTDDFLDYISMKLYKK